MISFCGVGLPLSKGLFIAWKPVPCRGLWPNLYRSNDVLTPGYFWLCFFFLPCRYGIEFAEEIWLYSSAPESYSNMLWRALVSCEGYEAFNDRPALPDGLVEEFTVSVCGLCELAVLSSAIYFDGCVFKLPRWPTPADLLGFNKKPEFLLFVER